MKSATFI